MKTCTRAIRIAGWLLPLLSLASAGCGRGTSGPGTGGGELTATVVRGDLELSVKAAGEIRARNASKVIPNLRRDAVLEFVVTEGTRVASNEVVARFNTDDLDRQIRELEGKVAEAQGRFDTSVTELKIQAMDNSNTLRKAEQDLRSAEMELERFRQGDESLERRNAALKKATALSALDRATNQFADSVALLKEGFVTEDEVEEKRMAAESARVALETSLIERRILDQYTLPIKRQGFEGAAEKAASELEKARTQTAGHLLTRTQARDLARKNFERLRADLDVSMKDLQKLQVRAPSDGIVTYGNPDRPWERDNIQVGGRVWPGQVLMTLPEMSAMIAAVNVSESDVRSVRTGQCVRVSIPALADRQVRGRVTKVAEVANEERWMSREVKEFRTEVALEANADLKPGFSCDAEIVTDAIASALYLPLSAVFKADGRHVVYLAPQGRRQEVRVGRASTRFVEILEGLKEGDRVWLNPPETPGVPR